MQNHLSLYLLYSFIAPYPEKPLLHVQSTQPLSNLNHGSATTLDHLPLRSIAVRERSPRTQTRNERAAVIEPILPPHRRMSTIY